MLGVGAAGLVLYIMWFAIKCLIWLFVLFAGVVIGVCLGAVNSVGLLLCYLILLVFVVICCFVVLLRFARVLDCCWGWLVFCLVWVYDDCGILFYELFWFVALDLGFCAWLRVLWCLICVIVLYYLWLGWWFICAVGVISVLFVAW